MRVAAHTPSCYWLVGQAGRRLEAVHAIACVMHACWRRRWRRLRQQGISSSAIYLTSLCLWSSMPIVPFCARHRTPSACHISTASAALLRSPTADDVGPVHAPRCNDYQCSHSPYYLETPTVTMGQAMAPGKTQDLMSFNWLGSRLHACSHVPCAESAVVQGVHFAGLHKALKASSPSGLHSTPKHHHQRNFLS